MCSCPLHTSSGYFCGLCLLSEVILLSSEPSLSGQRHTYLPPPLPPSARGAVRAQRIKGLGCLGNGGRKAGPRVKRARGDGSREPGQEPPDGAGRGGRVRGGRGAREGGARLRPSEKTSETHLNGQVTGTEAASLLKNAFIQYRLPVTLSLSSHYSSLPLSLSLAPSHTLLSHDRGVWPPVSSVSEPAKSEETEHAEAPPASAPLLRPDLL